MKVSMILLVTNGELNQASIGTDKKNFSLHSAPIQLPNKYPLLLLTYGHKFSSGFKYNVLLP